MVTGLSSQKLKPARPRVGQKPPTFRRLKLAIVWGCILFWPVLLAIPNPFLDKHAWLVILGAWLWLILVDWKKIRGGLEPSALQAHEPSAQATEPRPQDGRWEYPLLSIAGVALYFCWPVVIHTSLPFLRDLDTIEYVLLGAGSLLWLASCVAVPALLLMAAAERLPMRPLTFAVGWLLGWPLFVIAGVWLQASIEATNWFAPYLSWLGFYLVIPGTITWLATCYGLYDHLFEMLEAHWPATKEIRKIVSGILKSLLYHHHSF